jgi:hypothetical protein
VDSKAKKIRIPAMGGEDTPFELYCSPGYEPTLEEIGKAVSKLEKVLNADRVSLMWQQEGGLRITVEAGDAVRSECYNQER